LTAEVLELAANSARDNRKKRIRPRDVRLAVGHDTELSKVYITLYTLIFFPSFKIDKTRFSLIQFYDT